MRFATLFAAALTLLSVSPVRSEEPTNSSALGELRQEIQDRKREGELSWLAADLVSRGASEEAALDLAEQVRLVTANGPLKLERTRRHGDLEGGDTESARKLGISIRTFRINMLERQAQILYGDKNGSDCLAGVLDCIQVVDHIYNECLVAGLSFLYCGDLWLDLIENCEELLESCEPG